MVCWITVGLLQVIPTGGWRLLVVILVVFRIFIFKKRRLLLLKVGTYLVKVFYTKADSNLLLSIFGGRAGRIGPDRSAAI